MRTSTVIGIMAALALAVSTASAQDSDLDAALDAVAAKYMEGWNAGDAAACAATYSEDATEVDLAGHISKGRTAIQENIVATLAQYPGSTLEIDRSSLYVVKPDLVVSDGTWQVKGASAEGAPTKGFYSLVLAKQGDDWLILSGQAKVAPPAPTTE